MARMDELAHRKVVLISAPAGYGKTTVLCEWVHQAKMPVAWLSLDEDDNDVTRFLAYIVAAWERIHPGVREGPLGVLVGSLTPPIEKVLSSLVNEAGRRADHFAFVLDDYHFIEAPAIHQALTFIVEHLPPPMHLVLASRLDPPLPIPSLRARGELIELRAEDLRFTTDEVTRFFSQTAGIDLSSDESAALAARTEGWVAALQLTALSLRAKDELTRHTDAVCGKDRYIADYLAEQVLSRQPEYVRSFLLQTSLVERLCGTLGEALTGRADSQRILENLEQANLFLVPLDNQRQWYRYHALFAEFLRNELEKTAAGAVATLHRRASAWYAANALYDEAIRHALAGGDFVRAAEMVERNIPLKIGYGQFQVVAGWLKALPEELFASRPQLGLCRALFLLLGGQIGDCTKCLDQVEHLVNLNASQAQGAAEEREANLSRIAGARAILACFQNDIGSAVAFSNRAFRGLPQDDLFYRFSVNIALGDTYRRGSQWAAAIEPYSEALKIARQAPVPFIAIHPLSALGDLYIMRGQLRRAHEFRREALDLITERANRSGIPLPLMGWAHIRMGELLYEWNDLEGASSQVAQGIELAELGGDTPSLVFGYLALGQIKLALGDLRGATDELERAKPLVQGAEMPEWMNQFNQLQVQVWLAQGSVRTALDWVEETRFSVDDEASYRYEIARLAMARVLIAHGEQGSDARALDRAQVLLERLRGAAEAAGRMGVVIQVLALQALAYRCQGDARQALAALERALRLAEPEGYMRVFLNLGLPMAALLQEARSRGILSEYLTRLMGAMRPPAPTVLPDPLSERELQVLERVAAGLSNREIANELIIAVGTVKRHVATIYEKLGVNSRTQAVARARELGIL
jgi:LuxR family maltose regulon positive regulatory protein